ncbi:MAG: DUF1819 family protein [Gammaproteobacteria bacterium]|nr:DUF1819 family protein [Gammaproteobacteria bacterium]
MYLKNKDYSLAFASNGLCLQESLLALQLYQEEAGREEADREGAGWVRVRDRILADNLLQARKLASAKRTIREILFRLQRLSHPELTYLACADPADQRYLLWIAICRGYPFIGGFAGSVVREKYLTLAGVIDAADFDRYFEQEAQWHAELNKLTESSRHKLRQVLFRMLREAGLLTRQRQLIPATPSARFIQVVETADPSALQCLPMQPPVSKEASP